MARARQRSGTVKTLVAVGVVIAIALAVGLAVRTVWHRVTEATSQGCRYGASSISTSQASVASTMVGVVIRRALPQRAAVLVLAAGMQESKLTNIPPGQGDRDSVGVLQQRPSQGWGTETQLSDVHYATSRFLDALVKVNGWQSKPLSAAIQAVQRSADGSAYTKHESDATAVASGLWGQPRGVVCHFGKPDKAASVSVIAAQLRRDLPVRTPTVSGGSLHVPGASWRTVAWLVSNADRLGIDRVQFSGQRWTRADGWHAASSASAAEVVATVARV
jgi:hypothetical protein